MSNKIIFQTYLKIFFFPCGSSGKFITLDLHNDCTVCSVMKRDFQSYIWKGFFLQSQKYGIAFKKIWNFKSHNVIVPAQNLKYSKMLTRMYCQSLTQKVENTQLKGLYNK